MAAKSWWIKKRINPQFDHPYYKAEGQLSIKDAKKKEDTLYGTNYMYKFTSKEEYEKEIDRLKSSGERFV